MKPKLLLDEDVHFELAHALQMRGFDAVHAQELGRKGCSDAVQLAYAFQEQRCLLSFNMKDFVLLHNSFGESGQEHFGVIVSKQRPFRETLQRMLRLLANTDAETMRNQLAFL